MPTTTHRTPANIPSAPSSELKRRTPYVAPRGGVRKPPSSAMPPGSRPLFPLRKPGVPSAAVGIPPPSRPGPPPSSNGRLRPSEKSDNRRAHRGRAPRTRRRRRNEAVPASLHENGLRGLRTTALKRVSKGLTTSANQLACVSAANVLRGGLSHFAHANVFGRGGFEWWGGLPVQTCSIGAGAMCPVERHCRRRLEYRRSERGRKRSSLSR